MDKVNEVGFESKVAIGVDKVNEVGFESKVAIGVDQVACTLCVWQKGSSIVDQKQ